MHKFIVKYNLGGGTHVIYANDMADARKVALVEYRKNVTNIAYGIEKHSADEVINTLTLAD